MKQHNNTHDAKSLVYRYGTIANEVNAVGFVIWLSLLRSAKRGKTDVIGENFGLDVVCFKQFPGHQ